ncbi:hypothetical protein [Plastoroseomonas hellenica]|uniref:hypothetical protein n=1 Tax=Plastoroseomonas hellenica TaxID=2687306 RepID=UPI001BA57CE9|nr:hypothetical protein [Plastoroseomonas hellenica]MBR0644010.1 hypothetical protein [Plastoroseomonas hellenica]
MSVPSNITRWPLLIRLGRRGDIAALYLHLTETGAVTWSANRGQASRFYSPTEVSGAVRRLAPGTAYHTEEVTPA